MRRSVAVILICVMALLAACSTANSDSADTSATISDKTYVKSTAPAETQAVKKSFESRLTEGEKGNGFRLFATGLHTGSHNYNGIIKEIHQNLISVNEQFVKNKN